MGGPLVVIEKKVKAQAALAVPAFDLVHCQFAVDKVFPAKVLLPMKLVKYNNGVRNLLISSRQMALPLPIAEWIAESLLNNNFMIVIVGVVGGTTDKITEELGELYQL